MARKRIEISTDLLDILSLDILTPLLIQTYDIPADDETYSTQIPNKISTSHIIEQSEGGGVRTS